MADESKSAVLTAVVDGLVKLTWSRIGMALASVVVYYVYENRDKIMPLAFSSPMLLGFMGGGLIVSLAASAVRALVMREFEQYEARLKELQDKNDKLQADVLNCRTDCEETIKAALARIEARLPNL